MNSAIEFNMTDDTIMPKQIFAALSINGSDYGFSLVQSTYDKVYVLELYRIVSVKKRTWAFKTNADIRPVLSSLLKFVESSYPFIKSKMDGIIIDIPGKSGSEKYEKLLSRILKKTYISTFRVVPVKKTTDKSRNYIFITRKAIQPAAIFKSAAFHKHFEFDPKNMPVEELFTSENVDQMVEPYRAMKPTVSLEPSKRYAFKNIELANVIEDEEVNLIVDIAEKAKKSKGIVGVVDHLMGEIAEKDKNVIAYEYKKGDDISDENMPLAYLLSRGMSSGLIKALTFEH
jgi:hypothetical protein